MKYLILCGLAWSFNSFAQVNLDLPVTLGSSDKVYQSTADPAAAYLLPLKLETLSAPTVNEVDGEYHIYFTVGVNPTDISSVNAQITALKKPFTARVMRGYEVTIDPVGPMDIPRQYKAKLSAIGDAGDFGGPLPYMLSIKKIGSTQGKLSKQVIADTFNGKSARHLGTLIYHFNTVRGGQPYMAKTAVGIFSVTAAPKFFPMSVSEPTPLLVKLDSDSHCWENVRIGEICLK